MVLKNLYNFSNAEKCGWRLNANQKKAVRAGKCTIKFVPISKVVTVGDARPSYISRELITSTSEKGHCLPIIVGSALSDGKYSVENAKLRLEAYKKKGHKTIPIMLKA